MIYLRGVSKAYFSKHEEPKVVLRPTTVAVPTDRRVAILGDRLQGKTSLMRLLAGRESPDTGEVIAPVRLSPIVNSGTIFHTRLSGLENIVVFARMLGVDGHRLAAVVDAFCGLGPAMEKPLTSLMGPERQKLELVLVALLSFDCYLLDNASRVPAEFLEGYFDAAVRRGAGLIFTTNAPRQVYQYAEHVVVIADGTIREFDQVEEAVQAYERRPR